MSSPAVDRFYSFFISTCNSIAILKPSPYHNLLLSFNVHISDYNPSIASNMEDGEPGNAFESLLAESPLTCIVPGSLYVYAPNNVAPVFFAVALPSLQWAISGSVSKWTIVPTIPKPAPLTPTTSRYKCFKLIGLHPICAVLFAAGYALREYGAFSYLYLGVEGTSTLLTFIMSQVFIYICPWVIHLSEKPPLSSTESHHYIVPFSNSPTTTSSAEYSTTCPTSHPFLPAESCPLSVAWWELPNSWTLWG